MIKYLLEQKVCPTDANIRNICVTNYNKALTIVNLLNLYAVPMSQRTKELISLTTGIKCETFGLEPHISDRLLSLAGKGNLLSKKTKATPIKILRSMFSHKKLGDILQYMSAQKLTPDIYCFENAVIGQNLQVIMYVNSKYEYVPTILTIMMCGDRGFRVFLLNKFYPEMIQFNYLDDNVGKTVTVDEIQTADISVDKSAPAKISKPTTNKTVCVTLE
jgi:hypothetical protein